MSGDQNQIDEMSVNETVNQTLAIQADSIKLLLESDTISEITTVAELINNEEGRVIFTGIGKSGDVGKKISSTLNSIGISSHVIHPVEALHGDLGALSSNDVVILISNSGNTDEMVELLQFLQLFDATTVAITSNPSSKLGKQTDYHINTKVENEGAVVDLVPMASATVTMVIGDCLANALMASQDFSRKDYGHFHPGGTIGKRLLLTVDDLSYEDIPKTHPADTLAETAIKMSDGSKGIAVVQDDDSRVLGILTDGDMRRLIEDGLDLYNVVAEDVMITDPITTTPDSPAIQAFETLEEHNITQLVVVDESDRFVGIVHVHDIMKQGLAN